MSCKLIVMGVGGVGKSAITNRFVRGRWIAKYDPTIEESYQKPCEIDGQVLQVEILDTAGQDAYTSLRETFMHTGDGFMLVYSITDDDTLEKLGEIYKQIKQAHADPNVPILVIGNKVDLQSDRAVSTKEGEAFASKFGASFAEVSAKNNVNVSEAFDTLLRDVVRKGSSAVKSNSNVFGGKTDNSGDNFDYGPESSSPSKPGKNKSLFSKCEIL
jgi:GTPase KRas